MCVMCVGRWVCTCGVCVDGGCVLGVGPERGRRLQPYHFHFVAFPDCVSS